MLPKHFRWPVVQSVPRGTPDKLQQFRFYLHVCDSRIHRRPFWMTENHLRLHFSPFQINTQLLFLFDFLAQNGRRRPFWMSENHFRSYFSPFKINTQALFFWIFGKSLLIALLAISDQYATFYFFYFLHKMATGGHFGWPKSLLIAFLAISYQYTSFIFVGTKWPLAGIFRRPKINFDRISRNFRSMRKFCF